MNKKANKNYILQLPCDGIAMNVLPKYAKGRDIINYVEDVDFPKNSDGAIDKEKIRNETEYYLSRFLSGTSIGRVFFNVSYTRAATPSKCYDTFAYNVDMDINGEIRSNKKEYLPLEARGYPGFRYFSYTLRAGIDLIGYGIDYANRIGIEPWVSIRMNDHHAPDNPVINAHYRIQYASKWGIGGKANKMDYLVPEVRKVQLNYIKELCEDYNIAGIELDLLRTNPYMSRVDEDSILCFNTFVKQVKNEIKKIATKKGCNIKLAVRVFATPEINIKMGLDVAAWVAEGYIDILTVSNFFQPVSFDLPIKEWKEIIRKKNRKDYPYVILGGLDWGVMSSPLYHLTMNEAYTRGFVSSVFGNEGDGIYLFNTFNLEGHFATGYKIKEDGDVIEYNNFEARKAASDSLSVAESSLRRYTFSYFTTDTDVWNILPVVLNSGEEFIFDMQTGTASESGYYMAVIPVDSEDAWLELYLNGVKMRQIADMRRSPLLPYIPPKENQCNEVNHITQIGKRVLQFVSSGFSEIKDGRNQIVVKNVGKEKQKLVWFEIFFDGRKNADPLNYDLI